MNIEFRRLETQPLPDLATSDLHQCTDLSHHDAYNLVLDAERAALATQNEKRLLNARVVGYLMINLYKFRQTLGDKAIGQLTTEVVSSSSSDQIDNLGLYYREKLLRAFRQTKGRLPTPSTHSSRPSFATLEDMMNDCLETSGRDYKSAKKLALARDGYHCVLTGYVDRSSQQRVKDVVPLNGFSLVTHCCHILSDSTLQDIDHDNPTHMRKTNYASSVLAILEAFGLESLVDRFRNANDIHHLSNLIIVAEHLHPVFDRLDLWLEGTNTPNEYKICVRDPGYFTAFHFPSRVIQFTNHNTKKDIPLPDPALLALHATCARVAHLSGAAEYFNQCDIDDEDIPVLAEDGSSLERLHDRLFSIAVTAR